MNLGPGRRVGEGPVNSLSLALSVGQYPVFCDAPVPPGSVPASHSVPPTQTLGLLCISVARGQREPRRLLSECVPQGHWGVGVGGKSKLRLGSALRFMLNTDRTYFCAVGFSRQDHLMEAMVPGRWR